jgi:hypothetical protein
VLAEQSVADAQRLLAPESELATAAEKAGLNEHVVPDRPALDSGSHGVDPAGSVGARNVRHGKSDPGNPAPDPQVEMVESGGEHADADLTGTWLGRGEVRDPHDLRAAVALVGDCAHRDG